MDKFSFLSPDGVVSARIRDKDWSATALGAIRDWPQSLKTALGLLTHSGFPSSLFWGPEYVCFYNDAFIDSMPEPLKQADLLGSAAGEAWSRFWPDLRSVFARVMNGKRIWAEDHPATFLNKNHHPTFGTFNMAPVIDESGKPGGVYITCYETTEKVTVLKKTADDEEQLNFFIDSAGIGTWDLNPQTGIASANKWTKEWYGLPLEKDADFSLVMNAVIPKDRNRVRACIQNAIQKATRGKYEIIYRIKNAPNARIRIVRAKGKASFSDEPLAYRFQGTIEDITAEVNAHQSLRDSQEKFRKLMDISLVATVIFTGPDYIIDSPNRQMLAIWGKEAREVVGRPYFEAVSEKIGNQAHELLNTVYQSGERLLINERRTKIVRDGQPQIIYLNLAFEPILDANGKVASIMAMASEVTEKVNLQKVLSDRNDEIKKERLKASIEAQEKEREHLANELHDNVNQLLASTKLYIGMIEGADEQATVFKATCSEYIERCMTEIRNISHGLNPATLHFIGLSRSVRDMLDHLNEAGDIRFRFAERRNAKKPGEQSEVELAIYRITQIQVANILKHARARTAKVSLLYCHHYIELTIADDGSGLDIAGAKKGLGILNMLNRAESLQGNVTLESEPGKGCLLKVRIPWTGAAHTVPAKPVYSTQ